MDEQFLSAPLLFRGLFERETNAQTGKPNVLFGGERGGGLRLAQTHRARPMRWCRELSACLKFTAPSSG